MKLKLESTKRTYKTKAITALYLCSFMSQTYGSEGVNYSDFGTVTKVERAVVYPGGALPLSDPLAATVRNGQEGYLVYYQYGNKTIRTILRQPPQGGRIPILINLQVDHRDGILNER